jgi:hypothetical protein
MGPVVVVLLLPGLEEATRLLQTLKPVLRKALSSDQAVEGLDVGIVPGVDPDAKDRV